ncbi:MAG: hypothetical protein ACXVGO_13320, partial [Mycobacterium sp.]
VRLVCVGRVNRLAERRALRRAADLALLTSLGSPIPVRAGGAADQDFEYKRSEPTDMAAPVDHEPVTEPIPVAGGEDPSYDWSDVGYDVEEPAEVDVSGWDGRHELPPPAPPAHAEPSRDLRYVPPAVDFAVSTYRGQPWYRTKPAAAALVAAVLVTIVSGGWLLFPSADTAVQPSGIEAPTSAASTPTTAAPTAVSAPTPSPAPPPPPPPPPPQAERTYSPSQRQYSPRYSEPTPQQKPRVDVTRAPMSVAPVPRPVPGSGSNTPGDAPDRDSGVRRRGCFGFC